MTEQRTVAYFSMEIGLEPGMPTYSGGLGVLAGDTVRSAADLKVPWLLMTSTLDGGVVGNQTPETRRGVYPLLPPGDKFELVLNKAEHSAFTERALPGEKEPRNPIHHRVILATSTVFWDAYLRDDPAAKEWLTGKGPSSVMDAADRWQQK